MTSLSCGATFAIAATMAVSVVQLEVASGSSMTASGVPDWQDMPLHDVNRSGKSDRLITERRTADATSALDVRLPDRATAIRSPLRHDAPAFRALRDALQAQELQAWERSADIRVACEHLVSPMIAEELKIAPRRCMT